MFRIIYRQRRRILLTASLCTMAILVGLTTLNPLSSATPAHELVLTFGIFFCVIAVAVSIFVLILPQIRNVWEMLAAYTFFETSFIAAAPELNAFLAETGFRSLVSLLAWGLLYMTFYGPLLDRLPSWFSLWSRQRITVNATPQAVWNALIPRAADEEGYWSGEKSFETDDLLDGEDETNNAAHRPAPPGRLFANQAVSFVERSHPRHCRYYLLGEPYGPKGETSEGIFEMRINPDGPGRSHVDVYLFRSATRIREAMTLWFDDAVGDQADGIRRALNKLEFRKSSRRGTGLLSPQKTG